VESDPERQTLTLQQAGLSLLSQQAGDDVVVGITPPGIWRIQKQGDDTYSSVSILMAFIDCMPWLTLEPKYTRIEVHNRYWPTRAWTLNNTQPGTEVRKVNW